MKTIKKKIIKCRRCQRETIYGEENPYRPFCSNVCKNQDIGAWAFEEYKIPGPIADPEELQLDLQDDVDESDH